MSQNVSLEDQLKKLVEVQELDSKIDQVSNRSGVLTEELKTIQTQIDSFEKNFLTAQSDLDEQEKATKQIDAAIELNQDRMSRTSGRLEDVANNKEFQAASKEVEQLKKLAEELAGQKERAQAEEENLKGKFEELNTQRNELIESRDAKQAELNSLKGDIDRDLSELNSERGTALEGVDRSILSRYDRVRKGRDGVGIVPCVAGQCKGCNMRVPPQMYNELHKNREVIQCPSCQRILFVGSN